MTVAVARKELAKLRLEEGIQPVDPSGIPAVSFMKASGFSCECRFCGKTLFPSEKNADGIKKIPESSLVNVPCMSCHEAGIRREDHGAIFQIWKGQVPSCMGNKVVTKIRMVI